MKVDVARSARVGAGLRDACAPDFELAPSHAKPLGFETNAAMTPSYVYEC